MSGIYVIDAGGMNPAELAVIRGAVIQYLRSGRKRGAAQIIFGSKCGTIFCKGPGEFLDIQGTLFVAELVGHEGSTTKLLATPGSEYEPDTDDPTAKVHTGEYRGAGHYDYTGTFVVPIGAHDVSIEAETLN